MKKVKSDIVSNYYVRINQIPASIGRRIAACVIDNFLLYIYLMGGAYLIMGVHSFNNVNDDILEVIFVLFVLIPFLFYNVVMETINNGQTLGKMIMKIRVVRVDGNMPTMGDFILRWILLPVDMMLFIGLFFTIVNKNRQRIGDLVAGTMVSELNTYSSMNKILDEFYFLRPDYTPVYAESENLTEHQVEIIEKTLRLKGVEREEKINVLCTKLVKYLNIKNIKSDGETLLFDVVHDYWYYALKSQDKAI